MVALRSKITAPADSAGSVGASGRPDRMSRTFVAMSVADFVLSDDADMRNSKEGRVTLQQIAEAVKSKQAPGWDVPAAIRLAPEPSFRQAYQLPAIMVHAFNISCHCDRLDSKADMVCMVIYAHKGKTEWELDGIRCKAGYIIIKRSDSLQDISSDRGMVHGKLYKSVFGKEPGTDVVATGFAIRKGIFRFTSATLNYQYSNCQVPEAERLLIEDAVRRRFRPGATHADKVYPILQLQKKIVVMPALPQASCGCMRSWCRR